MDYTWLFSKMRKKAWINLLSECAGARQLSIRGSVRWYITTFFQVPAAHTNKKKMQK